ncbi:MAG: YidH family protein [Caulobacteraceae bacterium]
MIRNFSDHAANERTFLAWVRTAIAVMAFGFLVERFDLFLKFAGRSLAIALPHLPSARLGRLAGLALIVLGTAMVAIAAVRFLKTASDIDSPDQHLAIGSKLDIALASLLFLLGCALFIYLGQSLLEKL